MKNRVKSQVIVFFIGAAFLLAAAIVWIIEYVGEQNYYVNIGNTVSFLQSVTPKPEVGIQEERSNSEMPSIVYDGQDYSAILSLARLSVALPVRSSWNKTAVKKVPCRFAGNPYEGTLVIGGVDEKGQFDFVSRIDVGDVITVTDMKGYAFIYTVSTVKHSKNAKAKTLMDENYDLTLFAKDRKTGDWLLVRCNAN